MPRLLPRGAAKRSVGEIADDLEDVDQLMSLLDSEGAELLLAEVGEGGAAGATAPGAPRPAPAPAPAPAASGVIEAQVVEPVGQGSAAPPLEPGLAPAGGGEASEEGVMQQIAKEVSLQAAPEYGEGMIVASLGGLGTAMEGQLQRERMAHSAGIKSLQRYARDLEREGELLLQDKEAQILGLRAEAEREGKLRASRERENAQLQEQLAARDARVGELLAQERRLRRQMEERQGAPDGVTEQQLAEERGLRGAAEEDRDRLQRQVDALQALPAELEEERGLRLAGEQERDLLREQLAAAEQESALLREQVAAPSASGGDEGDAGTELAEELAAQTKRAEAAEEKLRALVAKIKAASSRRG